MVNNVKGDRTLAKKVIGTYSSGIVVVAEEPCVYCGQTVEIIKDSEDSVTEYPRNHYIANGDERKLCPESERPYRDFPTRPI